MRILWITNILFPESCRKLGIPEPTIGGWMLSLASQLIASGQIKLAIASIYNKREFKIIEGDRVKYYVLPVKSKTKYVKSIEKYWQQVENDFKPQIVHIHGTEFSHGFAYMNEFPEQNYIISIQGLVSIIERYYYSGIDISQILTTITLRDIVKRDTIIHARKKFRQRGIIEREYLKKARHVIGRTTWDNIHVKAINPRLNYYYCNESLRDTFYNTEAWDISKIRRYTIFISSASYPIKGFHQMLKAISLIKDQFPELEIRVSGQNIIDNSSIESRLRTQNYGRYLRRLIRYLNLQQLVKFIGFKNEVEMASEFKQAHVFVCPSSIENSPNSVGEAQIIGTPVIAASVGGIPDMIDHGNSGLLYRFDEYEMLAFNISQIFHNDKLALGLSQKGQNAARKRHNRTVNTAKMIDVYKEILKPNL